MAWDQEMACGRAPAVIIKMAVEDIAGISRDRGIISEQGNGQTLNFRGRPFPFLAAMLAVAPAEI